MHRNVNPNNHFVVKDSLKFKASVTLADTLMHGSLLQKNKGITYLNIILLNRFFAFKTDSRHLIRKLDCKDHSIVLYYTSLRFNKLGLTEGCATCAILHSVSFVLSNISYAMNIGPVTAQHLSRDLLFVASERMIQTKHLFREKVSTPSCTLNSE